MEVFPTASHCLFLHCAPITRALAYYLCALALRHPDTRPSLLGAFVSLLVLVQVLDSGRVHLCTSSFTECQAPILRLMQNNGNQVLAMQFSTYGHTPSSEIQRHAEFLDIPAS